MLIEKPAGHLDHLMRQTRLHHMQLSSMADLKANMLLTVASVVVTLGVQYLNDPELRWAMIVLATFCIATIALATYAAMPKMPVSLKPGERLDADSPTFNILFFGDFARLDYDRFEAEMETVMNDHSRTYEVQVRELYTLGRFLADKKYRFVRLAYLAFISGLIAAGITFILTTVGVLSS